MSLYYDIILVKSLLFSCDIMIFFQNLYFKKKFCCAYQAKW